MWIVEPRCSLSSGLESFSDRLTGCSLSGIAVFLARTTLGVGRWSVESTPVFGKCEAASPRAIRRTKIIPNGIFRPLHLAVELAPAQFDSVLTGATLVPSVAANVA